MYFTPFTTSILSLSLLLGCAVGKEDPIVRIELVPDAATVKNACSNDFKMSLQSQFSSWVSHGTAMQLGEADRFLDEEIPFQLTHDRDQHVFRKRGLRIGQQQKETRQLYDTTNACNKCTSPTDPCFTYCGSCGPLCATALATPANSTLIRSRIMQEEKAVEPSRRLTCTIKNACDSCCQATLYCYNKCGACSLCGASIVSPASVNSTLGRQLQEVSDTTAEESGFESGVSEWVQHSARRWLAEHDQTNCMGDSMKLVAHITFEGM